MTSRAVVSRITLTSSSRQGASVSRLTLTGTQNLKATVSRITLTGFNAAPAKAQVSRITISGLNTGPARAQVSRLTLTETGSFFANAGPGQTVDPLSTVILDASGSTGNPTSYSWVQVSNGAPTVEILGSGPIVSFIAPATPSGCDIIITLTISRAGVSPATDTASTAVRPQLVWVSRLGVWVPQTQSRLGAP